MIGRLAGFFLIVGGALAAVGAFPTWVTVHAADGSTNTFNAFTAAADYRDAIVSFGVAAALILIGFAMAVRPQLWSRTLACLAGMAAGLWAGLLFFTLAPQARDLIGPAPSTAMGPVDVGLGLWITAGGGAIGLLGGVIALAARRARPARELGGVPASAPLPVAAVPVATPAPASAPPARPMAAASTQPEWVRPSGATTAAGATPQQSPRR